MVEDEVCTGMDVPIDPWTETDIRFWSGTARYQPWRDVARFFADRSSAIRPGHMIRLRPKCPKCGDYHFPSEPHRNDYDDRDDDRRRPRRPLPSGGAPSRKLEDA